MVQNCNAQLPPFVLVTIDKYWTPSQLLREMQPLELRGCLGELDLAVHVNGVALNHNPDVRLPCLSCDTCAL